MVTTITKPTPRKEAASIFMELIQRPMLRSIETPEEALRTGKNTNIQDASPFEALRVGEAMRTLAGRPLLTVEADGTTTMSWHVASEATTVAVAVSADLKQARVIVILE